MGTRHTPRAQPSTLSGDPDDITQPSFIDDVMARQNPSHVDDTVPIVVPHINEHAARGHRPISPAPVVGWDGTERRVRSTDARDNAHHAPSPVRPPAAHTAPSPAGSGEVPDWVYANVAIAVAPHTRQAPESIEASPHFRRAVERAFWLGHYSGHTEAAAGIDELNRRIKDIENAIIDIRRGDIHRRYR